MYLRARQRWLVNIFLFSAPKPFGCFALVARMIFSVPSWVKLLYENGAMSGTLIR